MRFLGFGFIRENRTGLGYKEKEQLGHVNWVGASFFILEKITKSDAFLGIALDFFFYKSISFLI